MTATAVSTPLHPYLYKLYYERRKMSIGIINFVEYLVYIQEKIIFNC